MLLCKRVGCCISHALLQQLLQPSTCTTLSLHPGACTFLYHIPSTPCLPLCLDQTFWLNKK